MLAIKFQRIGKKHQPQFRIVVAEKRSKLGGPPTEDLGFYNPLTKEAKVNKEKAAHWMKMGAQPTLSMHNLFVRIGVLGGPKMPVKIKTRKSENAPAPAPVAAPVAPAPAPESTSS